MRKLATIQEVLDVKSIEGADTIELVLIKGWQCVAKKGEFKGGDKCVYFEVDSYLPVDDERYELLRRTSYRKNEFMGEGFRIKTISMRGEISQGLALPVKVFPEITGNIVGADVTSLLRVRKWELPEQVGNAGIDIGDKPYNIPTTDETRLQSMPEFLQEFKGKPYYITTKMDGTSCTIYMKDGKVGVCGRNKEYKEDVKSCSMWAWVHKKGLAKRLLELNEEIAIQGEFCGQGIQKNPLRLSEPNLFVFDIVKLDNERARPKAGLEKLQDYCQKLEIDAVPIEEVGESFDYTLEELLEKAKGSYPSGIVKEGIVVRAKNFSHNPILNHKMSFKVINNDFLKKQKD
jgi:RNA ligase (TIGR02306 family)